MLQSDDVVVVMVGDKLQVTEELQQTKEENTHRWWKHGALQMDKEESLACQMTSPFKNKLGCFLK